jgi:Pyrimidine dimer DNA glycosylase
MPYADFTQSAVSLDYRRLGKQRVEAKQLIKAIRGESKGWVNHPAAVMWRGHEPALAVYGMAMCREWIRRGYVDNLLPEFTKIVLANSDCLDLPPWVGDARVHLSHQANLVRKDPVFYTPLFGDLNPDTPYFWWSPEQELVVD